MAVSAFRGERGHALWKYDLTAWQGTIRSALVSLLTRRSADGYLLNLSRSQQQGKAHVPGPTGAAAASSFGHGAVAGLKMGVQETSLSSTPPARFYHGDLDEVSTHEAYEEAVQELPVNHHIGQVC